MKTLGQRIRELRGDMDMSLRDLARKIEASPALISDIELGRRFPSEDILVRIAKVLGSSAEELKHYDRRPPIEELKRKAASDPVYGYALRRIVEQDLSGEQLLKHLKEKKPRSGKDQEDG